MQMILMSWSLNSRLLEKVKEKNIEKRTDIVFLNVSCGWENCGLLLSLHFCSKKTSIHNQNTYSHSLAWSNTEDTLRAGLKWRIWDSWAHFILWTHQENRYFSTNPENELKTMRIDLPQLILEKRPHQKG